MQKGAGVPADVIAECRLILGEGDSARSLERSRALFRQLRGRPSRLPAWWPGARGRDLPAHTAVATDVGELLLPTEDEVVRPWLQEYGTWEPEETAFLKAHLGPGSRFLDVGGHVGYFSMLGARQVGDSGRVVALEPDRVNFPLLCANVQAADCRNVKVLPVASWDLSQMQFFAHSDTNSGDHCVAAPGDAGEWVPCVAVDDVLLPEERFDLVKVDIQGADHRAVAGMRAMIDRCRPALVVEFWPDGIRRLGDEPVEVIREYLDRDYALAIIRGVETEPLAHLSPEQIVIAAENHKGRFFSLLITPSS